MPRTLPHVVFCVGSSSPTVGQKCVNSLRVASTEASDTSCFTDFQNRVQEICHLTRSSFCKLGTHEKRKANTLLQGYKSCTHGGVRAHAWKSAFSVQLFWRKIRDEQRQERRHSLIGLLVMLCCAILVGCPPRRLSRFFRRALGTRAPGAFAADAPPEPLKGAGTLL